ncbi:MAG: integrase arm-type DNA-binding domain-containing protein, partial [Burkholderiales bacterium]|nr:integrase arm-type DNA-binding domain-containing protein [Burkholderiales bacterium]
MALTDTSIRNSKPKEKAFKVSDERGLFILINPNGSKLWRLKYSFEGKEKLLSLGSYPEVSLKDARERRDDARKMLANGIDPSENRKAQKTAKVERAANSFEIVAREWFAKQVPTWSAIHADRVIARLQRDIFPWLGGRPIADITAPELLGVIQRIENRGALETAHRAMSNCSQVFRYAVATGRAARDPSFDLRGALPPVKASHFAAQTEPDKVAPLLRAFDAYQGSPQVMCALRLAPLVFVRPGELRNAEWKDIDFDKAEWRYMATKTDTAHIVPLSTQALALLRELHPITGHGRYLFPSARSESRPMSDNAILSAMRRMEIGKDEMSGHGFRAMARTILDEVLGVR